MGTHPIFESDFDCLTDKKNQKHEKSALSVEIRDCLERNK